jgi:hypothetical protein
MQGVEMALDKLAACVKSLKQQRISVIRGMVGEAKRVKQDRSYAVRHYGCALLAYSLRTEALPTLSILLKHSDQRTVADARAAMDAIKRKNHYLFMDRDHSGKIRWDYASI